MEYNRVRIDLDKYGLKKDDDWHVRPLSDLHIGHKNFDLEKFNKTVKFISENNNYSTFFNGDLTDHISHRDKRFTWDSVDIENASQPVLQRKLFRQLTEPIWKHNVKNNNHVKSHGILTGNHEWVYLQREEFIEQFCEPTHMKYLGAMAFIFLDFYYKNKHLKTFRILSSHGSYGGSQDGGEVNQLKRFPARYDADIYCVGHSHSKKTAKSIIYGLNPGKGKSLVPYERKVIFANLGTFLHTHRIGVDNYPEKKSLYANISEVGTVTFTLNASTGDMFTHE